MSLIKGIYYELDRTGRSSAKRLWKSAVEHHAFFRLKEPRAVKRGPISFLGRSSRFQYSGKTFFQYRTAQIDRPKGVTDDILETSLRPSHQRTASVPVALNRGIFIL
ncbi:unnamed protein product [Hydatigera taeniaeformis]|uniref:PH domain-containing protein n=1 Tax=Hydatigena taeniaeformis TaxID=6205 RepID=A0A0R3WXI6_HYDTA|nr:unnamed protein product [Hydatigera taeniaeformis]